MQQGLYAGVSAPLVGVTPMCKLRVPYKPIYPPTHAPMRLRLT